jgi:hypothetical protein
LTVYEISADLGEELGAVVFGCGWEGDVEAQTEFTPKEREGLKRRNEEEARQIEQELEAAAANSPAFEHAFMAAQRGQEPKSIIDTLKASLGSRPERIFPSRDTMDDCAQGLAGSEGVKLAAEYADLRRLLYANKDQDREIAKGAGLIKAERHKERRPLGSTQMLGAPLVGVWNTLAGLLRDGGK